MKRFIIAFLLILGSVFQSFAGDPDLFYYVADGNNSLYTVNRATGVRTLIGATGVSSIEAIAFYPIPGANVLYAADAGNFGTINTATGAFTSLGQIDNGGTANGALGAQTLNDVDGMMLDGRTFKLWATNRRAGADNDLLFQINPATGRFVPNAFGAGVDYLVIDGIGVLEDIDDMAIDPVTGQMYATSNLNGSGDVLIRINKFTGEFTFQANLSRNDMEGLAFNNDGTLYGTRGANGTGGGTNNALYSINTTTGVATLVTALTNTDQESLAALVANANTVSGTVYNDVDLDGVKDGGEVGVANVRVYLYADNNNDGKVDPEDTRLQSVLTDGSGDYEFYFASTGNLVVSTQFSSYPAGFALTTDNVEQAIFTDNVNFDEIDATNDFGIATGPDCDGDGIPNFYEGALNSDNDAQPDSCDLDSDNDGILDSVEGLEDFDDDGIPNYRDRDSDDDGIPDALEANGGIEVIGYDANDGNISGVDSDNNGIVDSRETAAGSGVMESPNPDSDGDGYLDYLDLDSDNDGILDIIEAGGVDSDEDGQVDNGNDVNNNGYADGFEVNPLPVPNSDETTYETPNGLTLRPNYIDIDSDADGLDDTREGFSTPGYGYPSLLLDSDEDGIIDFWDVSTGKTPITPFDKDGDGTPDYLDLDTDNDGVSDFIEGNDANADGVADVANSGLDADGNGLDDSFDGISCGGTKRSITSTLYGEEDNIDQSVDIGSSDLELIYEDGDKSQIVGFRFTNVQLDPSDQVSSAYVQFEVDEVSTGSVLLTINGELATNSAAFAATDGDISNRTRTTRSIKWSPSDWNTVGEAGLSQRTADLSNIIEEIVAQGGWARGNAISFIITGSSTNTRIAANDPILVYKEATMSCGSTVAHQDFDGDGEDDWRDTDDDGDGIPTLSEIPDADGSGQPDYLETRVSACGVGFAATYVQSSTLIAGNAMATSGNIVGAPDDQAAYMENNNQTLEVDFGTSFTAGTRIEITWRKDKIGDADPAVMNLSYSTDGATYTDHTDADFPSNDITTRFTTIVLTTEQDFRYLRLDKGDGASGTNSDYFVDAIAVADAGCSIDTDNDGIGNNIDIDDDNDGILDVDEDAACSSEAATVVSTRTTPGTGTYTVVESGVVYLSINGGDGGGATSDGGQAATITNALYNVEVGDVIRYVVGAGSTASTNSAGGGGSTGLFINNDLVMVAGGGGGGDNSGIGLGANSGTAGDDGTGANAGTGGTGGAGASAGRAAGGGGINSAGGNGTTGGIGGSAADLTPSDGVTLVAGGAGNGNSTAGGAGFTGGGGATDGDYGGGAGGYSGGGGGGDGGLAGGGGSFINTALPSYVSGFVVGGFDGLGGDFRTKGDDGYVIVSFCNNDADDDGIINSLDLDSDNDGIADIIEAGGVDTDRNGIADNITDTDNDGWSNLFDSDDGGTALGDEDFDGDGLENRIDIDADNDGILDIVESQPTGELIIPIGVDSDNDGVDDAFDEEGGGRLTNPENTDGADNPDYLDLDSDNDGEEDLLEGWDTDNDGLADTTPSGNDADNDGLDDNFDNVVGPNSTTNVTDNGKTSSSYPNLDKPETAERDWREITDIDNDGIADALDIDNDNDGIPDSEEYSANNCNIDLTQTRSTPGSGSFIAKSPGQYTFNINGGDGGGGSASAGGSGSTIEAIFNIEAGDVIRYVIGSGSEGSDGSSGGAGSTGLFINNDLVLVAGGGGGGDNSGAGSIGLGGTATTSGSDGDGGSPGSGGTGGAGGTSGGTSEAGAGGGINSAGQDGTFTNGQGFGGEQADLDPSDGLAVASGGASDRPANTAGANGFTGGGGASGNSYSGGGGGYSGGGASGTGGSAGGGGSFINTGIGSYVSGTITAGVDGGGGAVGLDGDAGFVTISYCITDTDGDGIADQFDLDSDNDGIPDIVEAGGVDTDGNGVVDNINIDGSLINDTDEDGLADIYDSNNGGTDIPNLDTDGDGIINAQDLDSDNDGIPDVVEVGGTDVNGDGRADNYVDTDNDGFNDVVDGDVGNDGISENTSNAQLTTGSDGNSDGIPDSYPNDDFDGDEVYNFLDLDSDDDGILDVTESGGTDTNRDGQEDSFVDADNDGFNDNVDGDPDNSLAAGDDGNDTNTANATTLTGPDSDGDGRPNSYPNDDFDGDTRMDFLDIDTDNDGITDNTEAQATIGYVSPSGTDSDNDGIDDAYDGNVGVFGGGGSGLTPVDTDVADEPNSPDYKDVDSENDGISDLIEGHDTDGDELADAGSPANTGVPGGNNDIDGDGLLDGFDNNTSSTDATNGSLQGNSHPNFTNPLTAERDWREIADRDNDGISDAQDIDDDNDGILDEDECALTPKDRVVFVYTGSDQTYNVPPLATEIRAKVWGAGGRGDQRSGRGPGGAGGYTEITIPVSSLNSNTLIVTVGEGGNSSTNGDRTYGNGGAGSEGTTNSFRNFGAGGGMSAISYSTINEPDTSIDPTVAISEIIVIAGGGGTMPAFSNPGTKAGDGGGTSGSDATDGNVGLNGLGGNQVSGGGSTNGDPGGYLYGGNSGPDKGAGGGGYYGGGGGSFIGNDEGGGGGGSGYISNTTRYGQTLRSTVLQTPPRNTDPDYIAGSADAVYTVAPARGGSTPAGEGGHGLIIIEAIYLDCDDDGDGITNQFDLDSDNDGIPDIIEAGGVDSDNDGFVDAFVDSDGDGWADTFDPDPGQGGTPLTDGDQDGDGFPNRIDLDSDDDGLADIIEAGGADTDNDGRADNPADGDDDGWANLFDGDNGGTVLPVPDTDGDGTLPNYLDLDSDNDGIIDNIEWQTTGDFMVPSGTDANNNGWDDEYDDGPTPQAISNNDGAGDPDYIDQNSDGDAQPDWLERADDNEDGDALLDLIAIADAYETANGNPNHYVSSDDADSDDIPDFLEDADSDGTPNFLDPDNGTFYRDTDNDGIVDLYDANQNGDNRDNVNQLGDIDNSGDYDFRDATNDVTLPIELINFTASKVGKYVQLDWSTATEINNDYFTIQRSVDGEHFEYLLTEDGAGNSSSRNDYRRYDEQPELGYNYYKLTQTDFNGEEEEFNIEVVKFDGVNSEADRINTTMIVYPNPTEGAQLNLRIRQFEAGKLTLELMTAEGQLISQQTSELEDEVTSYEVEVLQGKYLAAGTYYLRVITKNNVEVLPFIVK